MKKTDTAIQKSKELTETVEFNPTPGMEIKAPETATQTDNNK